MSDGMFVKPVIAEDGRIIGWGRGPEMIGGASHHKELGTDLRFLRYVNGVVTTIDQAAQDAILAQDELDKAQAIADAVAAAEAAEQAATEAAIAAANAPFEVSKYKLCAFFQQSGKLDDFMAFVNADEGRAFLWNAAHVLDSDNPMVLSAIDQLSGWLPEGCTVRDFLLSCRA